MIVQRIVAERRRRRAVEDLARRIADETVDAVTQLVAAHVGGMTPCEARGYIRARAAGEVRRGSQAMLAAADPQLDAPSTARVLQKAVDRVSSLAMRRLHAARASSPTCSGQPTIRRRAA